MFRILASARECLFIHIINYHTGGCQHGRIAIAERELRNQRKDKPTDTRTEKQGNRSVESCEIT